ncbi:MAG TPA: hypothetical protein VFM80_03915 [Gracilimonas sp.]|nr:hypothetical protein [Gracilimonas sp.]
MSITANTLKKTSSNDNSSNTDKTIKDFVNINTTSMLLKTVISRKIKPESLITHHFKLDEMFKADEVFGNASKEKAMKVILMNQRN